MVLSESEESLITVVRTLPPEEARKVLDWARQLGDLGRSRAVEWSDSWSEEDLADAMAASLRRFDDREREGALAVCQAHMTAGEIAIPPFFGHPADWAGIKKWYHKNRPDVVVGFNLGHYYCLLEMGLRIPEDVKYIDLLKLEPGRKIAGVYHSEEEMRMKAAEHIDFLIRHKRKGIPKVRWGMLTPTSWGPGESLPV